METGTGERGSGAVAIGDPCTSLTGKNLWAFKCSDD